MLKKFLSALLAAGLVLSMAACSDKAADEAVVAEEQNPYEIYEEYTTMVSDAKSMESDMNMIMYMEMTEFDMEIESAGHTKYVMKSDTEVEMVQTMAMSFMGQDIEMVQYFKDGYIYQDANGQKIKMETNMEDMLSQTKGGQFDIPEEAVKSAEIIDNEDGTQKIDFVLDGSIMSEAIGDMLNSYESLMGLGEEELTFEDMGYSLVLDADKNLKEYTMVIAMNMVAEDEPVRITVTITCSNISLNSVENIEFPDDLDTYVSMDDMLAGMETGEEAGEVAGAEAVEGEAEAVEPEAETAEAEAATEPETAVENPVT